MMLLLVFFWFVHFTDKLGSAPIPFSERATENRLLWGVSTDSLDYAVVPEYIDQVKQTGARICYVSRWMNGATVEADSMTMQQIKQLPCVESVELTRDNHISSASVNKRKVLLSASDHYQDNRKQLNTYNLMPLHALGYEGQGIRIAVIDGAFWEVNNATCFDSIRPRIIATRSFAEDTSSFYSSEGAHGAYCLSFLAAMTNTYHGASPQAEYVLIRSEEIATESPKEMDNLVAALEFCDSIGVHIVSCSLGYRIFDNPAFNLTYACIDGRTTRASQAAAIAARKGMLLCFAAGNDGNNKAWNRICVPGDADSILTIGAITVDSVIGSFSSYGPAADGRVKPEVCAVGVKAYYVNPTSGLANAGNGTSYATPLVAGMAACLWSAMPTVDAQEIRTRIIQSAHLYPTYDPYFRMGYGIPNALLAYENTPTDMPSAMFPSTHSISKQLLHGQIVIVKNNKAFNLLGQRL